MAMIFILFGVFVTHNVEQTDFFKCHYDKVQTSCDVIEGTK